MKDIVLVTTTRYDSTRDTRFLLTVKTAEDARAAGVSLVVVDSAPDEDVRKHLTERGAHVFLEMAETKMGKGVALRQAIQQAVAFNPLVIMFLEPEKYELIEDIARIAQPILAGDALIVVPRRNTTSWKSYPREQYPLEHLPETLDWKPFRHEFVDLQWGETYDLSKPIPVVVDEGFFLEF